MCSFFGIITEQKHLIDKINNNYNDFFKKLEYRGPDAQSIENINEKTIFAGFVLAINDIVNQPIEKDGAWLMWNGEIYNYPDHYTNDTKYLIDFFNNDGLKKIFDVNYSKSNQVKTALDGEYSICYYKDNLLYLITDDFFTKPLCYSLTDDTFIFSSYESAIKAVASDAVVHHALPNSLYTFDVKNYSLLSRRDIYNWDFEPRHNTYSFWNEAYSYATKKRVKTDKGIFLPLSSGYDSGGICCEVLDHNVSCLFYSYLGIENMDILNKRIDMIKKKGHSHIVIDPRQNFEENFEDFFNKVENFTAYHYNGRPYLDIYHAYSCFAHFLICKDAKSRGYDICLSGHGADEIYSDYYSPNTKGVSVVKGDYSGWRKKWPNFDMGYGRNILGMFDRTAGGCGIETRYPYMDKNTVQNFLWLSDALKNKYYKQCQHQIMEKKNFPFDKKNLKVSLRIFEGDKSNKLFKKYLSSFYTKKALDRPTWIKF